jgi:23S rRNA (adenine2030-N6)-methyltransferase
MLSYRHGFHAGNFADVLKHSLVTLTINALKHKDKPFVYIDTHAGAGKYSLTAEFAQKTGEYQQGIGRIWQSATPPDEIKDYLAAIRAENTGHSVSGSLTAIRATQHRLPSPASIICRQQTS